MVFDTMVIAYALLGFTEFHNDAIAALRAAEEIWAPELLRAELLNVLWQWARARLRKFPEWAISVPDFLAEIAIPRSQ